MQLNKAQKALAYLRSLVSTDLADGIQFKEYEAKDGTKISTDESGKVAGDVADGDYELADGSTLSVKDGVATSKPTAAEEAPKEEKTADEPAKADEPAADEAPKTDEPAEAASDDALKQSIDALTAAIQQMLGAIGLKDQELAESKTKLAEVETKLADAEKQVEVAERKPVDSKPAVGQGLTALQDDTKLTKGQRALAHARAMAGR